MYQRKISKRVELKNGIEKRFSYDVHVAFDRNKYGLAYATLRGKHSLGFLFWVWKQCLGNYKQICISVFDCVKSC